MNEYMYSLLRSVKYGSTLLTILLLFPAACHVCESLESAKAKEGLCYAFYISSVWVASPLCDGNSRCAVYVIDVSC